MGVHEKKEGVHEKGVKIDGIICVLSGIQSTKSLLLFEATRYIVRITLPSSHA